MSHSATEEQIEQWQETLSELKQQLNTTLIGQSLIVRETLTTLLAGGHLLVEGVPGLGKTLLVRALAASLDAKFARIQFTPDLMPTDVTGHAVYDMKEGEFRIQKGPAFTNFLLADEINRAPAKTQAALLEVMQEQQITIEGTSYRAHKPFMVLATQNPIEQEGTYPLPEAELDRFMMKVLIDFPNEKDEVKLVHWATKGIMNDSMNVDGLQPKLNGETLTEIQEYVTHIEVDRAVLEYAVDLVRATRAWPGVSIGAGPRASIGIVRCARASAMLEQRNYVLPDDVKRVAKAVLRHRIQLSAELEIEGQSSDQIIESILAHTQAPAQ